MMFLSVSQLDQLESCGCFMNILPKVAISNTSVFRKLHSSAPLCPRLTPHGCDPKKHHYLRIGELSVDSRLKNCMSHSSDQPQLEWIMADTLPETNSSHLKMDDSKMKSPFGMAYFQGLLLLVSGGVLLLNREWNGLKSEHEFVGRKIHGVKQSQYVILNCYKIIWVQRSHPHTPGRYPGNFTNSLWRNFFLCGGLGKFGVSSQGMWAKSLMGGTK